MTSAPIVSTTAFAALLLLGACGSSGDSDSAADSTRAESTAPTETAVQVDATFSVIEATEEIPDCDESLRPGGAVPTGAWSGCWDSDDGSLTLRAAGRADFGLVGGEPCVVLIQPWSGGDLFGVPGGTWAEGEPTTELC